MSKTMTLKPRMTEKAYMLSQKENTYVFDVPTNANKLQIADAVEAQFEVNVENVRVVIAKGKTKTSYRKRSRGIVGKRTNRKKAYVVVKEGDSIPVFAAIEEAEAKEQKIQEKADKAAKKKESK